MTAALGPLLFERHFVEKVWGGRSLERRPGFELPAGARIGETWEIVDRDEERSVVARGRHRGRTLGELMAERGAEIVGDAPMAPTGAAGGEGGRFPLLVKYIDASENLSVQVHPDESAARRLGRGAEPKTEAWYVVGAAGDAALYCGLRPDVDADELARIAAGPEVVDALVRWSVRPGDCMAVPGGTVHAIGAGVTILEVQQNSDTTYRLYDWGRVGLDGRPRETHVEEALACARLGRPARPPARPDWSRSEDGLRSARLVDNALFTLDGLALSASVRMDTRQGDERSYRIYAVVEGSGRLDVEGDEGEAWRLAPGDVWLVPAACGYHRVTPDEGRLTLIRAFHQAKRS